MIPIIICLFCNRDSGKTDGAVTLIQGTPHLFGRLYFSLLR